MDRLTGDDVLLKVKNEYDAFHSNDKRLDFAVKIAGRYQLVKFIMLMNELE